MSDYKWFVMAITHDMESAKPVVVDNMRLIGPFENGRDAADWGYTHCSPGGPDHPRWNSVLLNVDDKFSTFTDPTFYALAVCPAIMTHVKAASYPRRDMNKPPIVTDEGLHKDAERHGAGVGKRTDIGPAND